MKSKQSRTLGNPLIIKNGNVSVKIYVGTIEDVLDTGLPRIYTPELYRQKCSALFEHVYESYAHHC